MEILAVVRNASYNSAQYGVPLPSAACRPPRSWQWWWLAGPDYTPISHCKLCKSILWPMPRPSWTDVCSSEPIGPNICVAPYPAEQKTCEHDGTHAASSTLAAWAVVCFLHEVVDYSFLTSHVQSLFSRWLSCGLSNLLNCRSSLHFWTRGCDPSNPLCMVSACRRIV
jgi:hypothetical protein